MSKLLKEEEGQALVEFALVVPILLLLVCGIIDFGWMFYNQLSLENACREGARVAAVNSTDTTNRDQLVEDKVKENLIAGVMDVDVTSTWDMTSKKVTVEVKAEIKCLTPVLGTFYRDNEQKRPIKSTLSMKIES